jgi:hypothetical protein
VRRRHGLEVEDEGLLKDLIVIFVFLGCFVLFVVCFNVSVLFAKKKFIARKKYFACFYGGSHYCVWAC